MMKFNLIRSSNKPCDGFLRDLQSRHIEAWVLEEMTTDEIEKIEDRFWEGYGDIVRDENGMLFVAAKIYKDEAHYGQYGIWYRILDIKAIREKTGMSRQKFSEYLGVPYRTLQDWENWKRDMKGYVLNLIMYKLINEGLFNG